MSPEPAIDLRHEVAPPSDDELICSDGEPMDSERHRDQMSLLIELLQRVFRESDQDAYVSGNMFVYFSELQTRGRDFRGPDVFAVLNVDPHPRLYWVAWKEEGRLPDLVIEILSDSTREMDKGEKKRIYEQVWRVSDYVLYDPFSLELEAWRHDGRRLVRTEPNAEGRLPLSSVGLSLGVVHGSWLQHPEDTPWLRLFDAEGGMVPATSEVVEAEAQRAAEAEARVQELEALLAAGEGPES